jgi:hypothetical protein
MTQAVSTQDFAKTNDEEVVLPGSTLVRFYLGDHKMRAQIVNEELVLTPVAARLSISFETGKIIVKADDL